MKRETQFEFARNSFPLGNNVFDNQKSCILIKNVTFKNFSGDFKNSQERVVYHKYMALFLYENRQTNAKRLVFNRLS